MNIKHFTSFTQNRNLVLLFLFLSALIIKLLIFYLVTDPIIFYKYPYFAEQIANGKDIGERLLDISPFYLLINLLSYYFYGTNWEALVIIQILIGSLNCILVLLIGEKIFNRTVGVIAAVIIMLYGNLTLIDLTLEPEAILIFLNSLIILISIKAKEASNSKKQSWLWFITGLLIGLSAITKPNSLLVLVGVLVWTWLTLKNKTLWIKSASLLLLGTTILIAPVTIRNYVKFNDFVLVTADGGKVFYHGNGPEANGMARADLPHQGFIEEGSGEPDYAHVLFRKTAKSLSGKMLKPSESSQFWTQRALAHIKADFSSWLYLEFKKLCFFWKSYEVHDIDSNYKNYLTVKKLPLINFGIISVLGILGMILSLKRFRQVFLLHWMVLAYLITVMVFFASSRYRIPAAPFLAIFAAVSISHIFYLLKEKKIKILLTIFSFILVFGLFIHFAFQKEFAKYDQWQKATRIYYSLGGNISFKKGMYQEAIDDLKKAIELEPNFEPAYNLLGKSYAILNNYPEAEKNFKKVIELTPGLEEGYLNLGLLYKLRGENDKADYFLRKALEINPNNQKIKKHIKNLSDNIEP